MGACHADLVMLARFVVVEVGVFVPFVPIPCNSTSDESGVVGREVCVLKEGRRSEVREGEGGRGVGGRL